MKTLITLLFIVQLWTEPVIGIYEDSVVNRTLACMENKLDLVIKGLANLDLDVKTNNRREQIFIESSCLNGKYDGRNLIHHDHQTSLDEMWIKTEVLFTGFQDLKMSVTKLIKVNHDSLKHQIQALKETTKSDAEYYQAIAADITMFDDKFGGIETRLDEMTKLISTLEQSVLSKECPAGWQKFRESCYYLHETPVKWKDAVNLCKFVGAQLVEYDDMEEIDFVLELARNTRIDWGSYKWRGFYIGGSDIQSEGNFIWETSKSPVQSLHWFPGEPSNSYWSSKYENCMETLVNRKGRWNDNICSELNEFVCEKKL